MNDIITTILLILILLSFIIFFIVLLNPSKIEKKKNKVHFYVARNKNNRLWLYMGKPRRYDDEFRAYLDKGSKCISGYDFNAFGLNEKDYDNLKWEDEPIEVFLNMED